MTRGSFVRQDVEEQELLSHVPEQEQAEEAAAATPPPPSPSMGAEDERHRIKKKAKKNAAPQQSKCPAPKELLKQRIEYKLCSNDDDVMEWHGGVVKKKYKTKPGWYSCALDDGTAVVLLFENSNRDNVWRIVKPAAQPAAKPMIAFATAPSSPRASPSAAAKPSDVPAFDAIAMSPVSRAVTASEAATAPKIMPPGTLGSSALQQSHVVLLEGEGRFWSALQAQEAPDPPTPPSTAICAS